MTYTEKIDEWIKEAETRPGSALMIMKLIAGRLRELTQRNEELLAENIALQDGSRVEEYQKRIAYLEFELSLLKKRVGAEESGLVNPSIKTENLCLLVYNAHGRILRLALDQSGDSGKTLGRLVGDLVFGGEITRLLALAEQDEIMFLFSSGRISTLAVKDIPAATSSEINWSEAFLPDEPHAGELLVCLSALSHLPTSDFILQASRRGSVKKTHTSISDKVLAGHYLGRGTNLRMDEPLEVNLTGKKAILVMVTSEGRMLGLDVDSLSYAAEERIQLSGLDFVVAGFVPQADESILCLTQNGKVIQREMDSLELAKSSAVKGQALIPHSRLEQGTRFVGALPVRETDRLVLLDSLGNISLHQASDAIGAGKVTTENQCLSITRVPPAVIRGA